MISVMPGKAAAEGDKEVHNFKGMTASSLIFSNPFSGMGHKGLGVAGVAELCK